MKVKEESEKTALKQLLKNEDHGMWSHHLMDREAWRAAVHGVTRVRHDWATEPRKQKDKELTGFDQVTYDHN